MISFSTKVTLFVLLLGFLASFFIKIAFLVKMWLRNSDNFREKNPSLISPPNFGGKKSLVYKPMGF